MTKRAFSIIIAAVIAAAAVLPGSVLAQDKPESVTFAYFNTARPWLIGKAEGTFEKRMGVPIEWRAFSAGGAALSALAAGEVDISRLGSSPTVAGIANGLPIDMIGISGVIATSEQLIARDKFQNLADLKGHPIAYPPASTAQYALMAAIEAKGFKPSDFQLVALSPTGMVAAWKRGDIDAAWVWGPFSHQMAVDGGHAIMATKDLQDEGYLVWNDYVVRLDFAKKHPSLVTKFLETHQALVERYKADPKGAAKIIAKVLDQDLSFVLDTLKGLEYPSLEEQLTKKWLGNSETKANVRMAKAMMDTANYLASQGVIKKENIPDSFTSSINTSYMEQAVK